MSEQSNSRESDNNDSIKENDNWGPKLFLGALAVVLAFFYWLLIYSGGAVVHH